LNPELQSSRALGSLPFQDWPEPPARRAPVGPELDHYWECVRAVNNGRLEVGLGYVHEMRFTGRASAKTSIGRHLQIEKDTRPVANGLETVVILAVTLAVIAAKAGENWRGWMGIEPTQDALQRPANGFEDRGSAVC
jgi:hypothetical protein